MRLAPIPGLKQRRREIMEGAVKFIANTQHCDAHREIVLARVENGRSITIRKVGSSPTQVGALMVIGLPKFAAQARVGLAALIQERVQEKQRLLRRIYRPRILLLVDSYVYSDKAEWLAALRDTDVGPFIPWHGLLTALAMPYAAWSESGLPPSNKARAAGGPKTLRWVGPLKKIVMTSKGL
jgi:hypothetical protein